ncbi:MAG TPA: CBS domain-containing protein [Gemmatimonadales bacterium]|nr:CBS domain-containing protein [Gemmatimonadales bacterium]
MSAGRICSRVIATASPDESIRAAARRMAEYDVGTLVVLEGDGVSRAIGVVTDRDIVIRCVGTKLDPDLTPVSALMTAPAQSVSEHTPIEDAISRMASAGTRRLVVTGDGERVVGILSLDDVLDLLIEETGAIGRLLEKQKPRIPV